MLEINNIKVSYGEHEVLKGASLKVLKGTAHGILGMNGAGKTTLFETLYGQLSKLEGKCIFNDAPLTRNDIAYLESESYFYPYITGKEYLLLCANKNPDFNITEWNGLFKLPLQQLTETYSTGMKQKLALMGTLATNRPIIIMDEPFNGVDLESSEIIYQIIDFLKTQEKFLLISSHIMETLTHTCDQISHLHDGQFIKTYQKEAFPQMQQLLRKQLQSNIQGALNRIQNL